MKVEGKRVNVLEAKKMILEVLETRVLFNSLHYSCNIDDTRKNNPNKLKREIQVNKVTLKMDVAHTEHSHVIGKGGGNIKKVMEVTSCHIHFPDSNRHNAAGEKSNQVT